MKIINILVITILILGMAACSRDKDKEAEFIPVNDLIVSEDFNWDTAREVDLELEVLTNANEPISDIVFEIFDADPATDGVPVAKGSTDDSGKYVTTINLPTRITKLWAQGFMSTVELPITNNSASYTFGGMISQLKGTEDFEKPSAKNYSYLPGMSFNNNGVPSPMTNDVLSADFLQRINATLPESRSVPEYHPSYLSTNNQTNIKIDELAEVWITFVHEGAGYQNALGFHTFPSNQPPATPAQVGTKTLIFPNASLYGSDGGLRAGNKVYMGIFQPGTTIGWFLVADGFQYRANVNSNAQHYYSIPALNPEVNPANKQHSILVHDAVTDRLLIGFEDLKRDYGSDDDFNDVVFYVSVNPIEAVDLGDVPPMDTPADRDNDGVSDLFDDYPDDPAIAFDNHTFGEDSWGTLAFEDLWPDKGDYDFNDLVIDYNFNQITAPGNLIKKVEMQFKLRAIGARMRNGFAVQMPFSASNVASVTSSHPALFELETDGLLAVLRIFNNAFDLIPEQSNAFINTEVGSPWIEPVNISLTFNLNTPVAMSSLSLQPPYNPFIYVNNTRSHEIHLPGYPPTSRMNSALFGTGDDDSQPSQNRYYKTSNNLPWAVNIASSWDYPVERTQVTRGYLKFKDWAQSSGQSYPDWYIDNPGFRDELYIYQTP